jgi:hypothetical protein
LKFRGQRVRPGIEAPVEIKVLRDEPVAERETAAARGKTDDRPVDAGDEGGVRTRLPESRGWKTGGGLRIYPGGPAQATVSVA